MSSPHFKFCPHARSVYGSTYFAPLMCIQIFQLTFLHKEFHSGRMLFRNSRSIKRLKCAVQNFIRPFGDLSAARHAVRFNMVGKGCRSKAGDLSFAIKVIRSYDASQSSATKSAIRSAKRMAYKINHGIITFNSRRRAGSWITQSNETARNGPSECKILCKNIVHLNQRKLKRSRLSRPSITTFENARVMIISRKWKSYPIGSSALTGT